MKRCISCEVEKPLTDYYTKGKYYHAKCKPCLLSYQKSRYNPKKTAASSMKRRYGVALEQYSLMLDQQSGGCAICGDKETIEGRALYIDHDHTTGRVRGLLCHKCNTGLGSFRDTLDLLKRACSYLEER